MLQSLLRQIGLVTLLLVGALSAGGSCGASSQHLVIVPDKNVATIREGAYTYTIGTIDLFSALKICCPLTLSNDSDEPLKILDVVATCGCTSARLVSHPDTLTELETPFLLDAHKTVTLEATLDFGRLAAGPVRKSVFIHSTSGDINVELSGFAVGPASFSVASIDFGSVRAGQHVLRPFAVQLDPRIAHGPFHLLSDDSNVIVMERPGGTALRREYEAAIVGAPRLGPIFATLTLAPQGPEHGSAYDGALLAVNGTVEADVDASPAQAVFGLVKAGTPARMQIEIRSLSAHPCHIGVHSMEEYIHASLAGPSQKAGGEADVTLNIALGADAPVGEVTSRVIVTTAGGAKFAIPVMATVARFAPAN